MKALLFAPDTNPPLPYASMEIQAAMNALHPEVLLGPQATINGLKEELRNGYDLVICISHGDERGIMASDGHIGRDLLVPFFAGSETAVLLNTCSSFSVASAIHRYVGSPVICTVTAKLDDYIAAQTSSIFTNWLAEGKTLREAYELSQPDDPEQRWWYFNNSVEGRRNDRTDDLLVMQYETQQEMAAIRKEIVTLRDMVQGGYFPRPSLADVVVTGFLAIMVYVLGVLSNNGVIVAHWSITTAFAAVFIGIAFWVIWR